MIIPQKLTRPVKLTLSIQEESEEKAKILSSAQSISMGRLFEKLIMAEARTMVPPESRNVD